MSYINPVSFTFCLVCLENQSRFVLNRHRVFVCLFAIWPYFAVCGILVLRAGTEPMSPGLGAWSLNHCTASKILYYSFVDLEVPCLHSCFLVNLFFLFSVLIVPHDLWDVGS